MSSPAVAVPPTSPAILLVSTADTDLLAARAAAEGYRVANPARVPDEDLAALLDGVGVAVVRLLGGARVWERGLAALARAGIPALVLGGEATPDADLMALSSVPLHVVAEASRYLIAGGPENLARLARYLRATVLAPADAEPGGEPEPPLPMPEFGVHSGYGVPTERKRPTVGVVYYRAHELSGNTAFVETLCDALDAAGADPLPVFCGSLRTLSDTDGLVGLLQDCDALIATVLAGGGTVAADASAGGDEGAWDVGALAALDIPVLQGLCLTTSRAHWQDSDAALSPMDAAMQVAIPEFDGRLITVPFSFKETGPDGLTSYVTDPERTARVAGIAVKHAALRHVPAGERRVALMLSAYPTKHARIGNAVGLDTPASVVALLAA
ncbi:MAG TPA: cobaltochelatase subunit CobN, partial [Thermoleophilia bacterium]|nr:cobaltochelatase subunit CobN [Thermoleophilia bacterium]